LRNESRGEVLPPHDTEAEAAVLGSILLGMEDVLIDVSGILGPEDFFLEKHAWIYSALLDLYMQGKPLDQITVAHELSRRSQLNEVGGIGYITQLIVDTPTTIHAVDYAELVYKAAFNRKVIRAAGQIAKTAYDNGEPADTLLKAQNEFSVLSSKAGSAEGLRHVSEIASIYRKEIEEFVDNPNKSKGVTTGFSALDSVIGGFEPGVFYVLGGRPSAGKSQLSLAFAVNAALSGAGVAVFSPEMGELRILFRLVLSMARINRYQIRMHPDKGDWRDRFWKSLTDIESLPLWIDQSSSVTTSEVRARVSKCKQQHPELKMLIFDYANLAQDTQGENEVLRMAHITHKLRAMAKDLDVAVLSLYQLNRAVEYRDDKNKRPIMADLRDSGSIEQDADVIMFVFREAYYLKMANKPVPPEKKNLLEVIVAKQRDGEAGVTVNLDFDLGTGFITDWSNDRYRGQGTTASRLIQAPR
jgi:replicative DNA helicase